MTPRRGRQSYYTAPGRSKRRNLARENRHAAKKLLALLEEFGKKKRKP